MVRVLAAIVFLTVLTAGFPAKAQDAVGVRLGEHDGFSRVVFDWPNAVPYDIAQEQDGTLRVTFKSAASFDLSGASPAGPSNVKSVEILSAAGNETQVAVHAAAGQKYRHFQAGNRLILDVYGDAGKTAKAEKPREEPKPEAEKKPPGKPPAVAPEKQAGEVAAKPAEMPNPEPAAPTPSTEAAAPPAETMPLPKETAQDHREPQPAPAVVASPVQESAATPPQEDLHPAESTHQPEGALAVPHGIYVTVTEAVGMAAFVRGGMLWIVLDHPDMTVKPQVTGPQKDKFKPFERVEAKGATVFRTELPQGARVYGEGGGLMWRLVVGPYERHTVPAEIKRMPPADHAARGASIEWKMPMAHQVIEVTDPSAGDNIKVVTVASASDYAGDARRFVDFTQIDSPVGMAIAPSVDDLTVSVQNPDVIVSRPEGLALADESALASLRMKEQEKAATAQTPKEGDAAAPDPHRVFKFDSWLMGGRDALTQNQKVLMSGMAGKDDSGKAQDTLTLGKVNLANGWGAEALGFFNLAAGKMDGLDQSPEFLALRGASEALAGQPEMAIVDLKDPGLDEFSEIGYWRAYALGQLEDWQQAAQVLPEKLDTWGAYPPEVQKSLGLVLAEVALRDGKTDEAAKILDMIHQQYDRLSEYDQHAWDYLSGEVERQRGNNDKALALWEPLAKDMHDPLYRAKAGLASADLLARTEKIKPSEAVDRLERLRYAWRGDELETRIDYRLAKAYLNKGDLLKGMTIMKDAASLQPDTKLGQDIAGDMKKTFSDIFMTDQYKKNLSPLDAISLFEEFPELVPQGDDGDRLSMKLAETLVRADLLDRATKILEKLLNTRLQGEDAVHTAIRLAAIQLMDAQPAKALTFLDRAEKGLAALPPEEAGKGQAREIKLLRARALSKMDQAPKAIDILETLPQDNAVNRLRADIAWQSGQWDESADALAGLIADSNVTAGHPLTKEQADLILNRAVALNLADNRVALANDREKYSEMMKDTTRARMYDVVTRPRQSAVLADRDTMMSIVGEADMFKDFLDSYRNETAAPTQ